MAYDYRKAMYNDIMNVLSDYEDIFEDETYDGAINQLHLFTRLYEALVNDDSVTGAVSGSYTCDQYESARNIGDNWGLMIEANEALDYRLISENPCDMDVRIRVALLEEVLDSVLGDVLDEDDMPSWLKEIIKDSIKDQEE